MKSVPTAAFARPLMLWSTLAVKTFQLATAATQVVAIRGSRIAAAGAVPDADDQREFSRMGSEKLDAFSRAGHALATGAIPLVAGMAAQSWRLSLQLAAAATRLAASRTTEQTFARQRALADVLMAHSPAAPATAAARLAHRALAPVHATATANARRLAKAR